MHEDADTMIAFGPVPSRRLGRSMGINTIPPKACTYSCVYCQLGRTVKVEVERRAFYDPEAILGAVEDKIEKAVRCGEAIDYLTFVPDGEPTLDIHLEKEIGLLRPLGIKIAVITNGSLVWREDVQAALMKADWVSLKVDSVQKEVWRRINRPHGSLSSSVILDGMLTFAGKYRGELVTETMLLEGLNDDDGGVGNVADYLARLKPARAYLSIPHRPPAEKWACTPGEATINRAYQILSERLDTVEYLIGYEGNAFTFTGDAEEELLGITSVHPMRADAVGEFLKKAKTDWGLVDRLIRQGQLVEMSYRGQTYYLRKLRLSGR